MTTDPWAWLSTIPDNSSVSCKVYFTKSSAKTEEMEAYSTHCVHCGDDHLLSKFQKQLPHHVQATPTYEIQLLHYWLAYVHKSTDMHTLCKQNCIQKLIFKVCFKLAGRSLASFSPYKGGVWTGCSAYKHTHCSSNMSQKCLECQWKKLWICFTWPLQSSLYFHYKVCVTKTKAKREQAS